MRKLKTKNILLIAPSEILRFKVKQMHVKTETEKLTFSSEKYHNYILKGEAQISV